MLPNHEMASREVQDALLAQLKQPFDPKFLKWRIGATNKDKTKGIALAYIDAREVMKRLDDVCGVAGWQNNMREVPDGFVCDLTLFVGGQWVNKSNGAGRTQVEPVKGGMSDALKRSASVWGVGRYLYYLPTIWVAIKPAGRSFVLAEIPELPNWALPNTDIRDWQLIAEQEFDAKNSVGMDGENDADAPVIPNQTTMDDIIKANKK